jgi:hypothetical protein
MYQEIEKRNEAIQLLKSFVKLSSVLLPYYAELRLKRELNENERMEKLRLEKIYENYEANPKTSEILINSKILALIQNTYICLAQDPKSKSSKKYLRDFYKEWRVLRAKWDDHMMN